MGTAKHTFPLDSPQDKPWTVYRFFDGGGVLLYVGVTGQWRRRLGGHQASSRWFDEAARVEFEHYADRRIATDREATVILAEHPRYNKRRVAAAPPRSRYGDGPVRLDITISRATCDWLEERAARLGVDVPVYVATLIDGLREVEEEARSPWVSRSRLT